MNKRMIRKMVSMLTAGALLCACGCAKDTPQDVAQPQTDAGNADGVNIAAFFSASGASADYGVIDFRACQFAVDWINDKGGIASLGGAKLNLITGDLMSDATQAKAVAERVLSNNKISAVVGSSTSSTTIPMLPVLEKARVPMVTSNYSPDIVGQGYSYIFMPCAKGTQHAQMQADFMKWMGAEKGVSVSKAAIVFEDSEVGRSTLNSAAPIIEGAGAEIVYNQSFPPGLSDASSIITAIKNSGAEVVFVNAQTADLKQLLSTMKSMRYSPIIFGSAGGILLHQFAEDMGDECLGIVATAACAADSKHNMENEEMVAYFNAYREEFGVQYIDEHVAQISNLIFTVAAGIEKAASTDGTEIRDAIASLDAEFVIPGGPYAFDETGWNTNSVPALVQWQKTEDGSDYECRMIYPQELAHYEYVPLSGT